MGEDGCEGTPFCRQTIQIFVSKFLLISYINLSKVSLYFSSSKGVQLLLTCCVFFFFLDIDECKADVYPCKDQQHCTNLPGSYKCYSKYQ